MKTRKLFVAMLVLIFGVTTAMAQGPGRGHGKHKKTTEERAQKQTEWMTAELQLTPEQAAKVKEINLKHAKISKQKREAYKAERKANQDKRYAELDTVLTPEQQAKLKQSREERKSERKMRRKQMRNCIKDYKTDPTK